MKNLLNEPNRFSAKSWLVATVLAASALVGCSTSSSTVSEAEAWRDLAKTVEQMQAVQPAFPRDVVVKINIGDRGVCSGVVTGPNLVLTAAHCVPDGETLTINGNPVALLKKDEQHDLALLVTAKTCPCSPVAIAAPRTDAPVVTIGYPLGLGQVATEGKVQFNGTLSFKEDPTDYSHYMLVTTPAIVGNSGGGVFQLIDGKYHLVGIMSGIAVAGGFFPITHLGHAVNAETINKFFKSIGFQH